MLIAEINIGPNAVDKEDIIAWTLKDFETVKVDKKIVILQYGDIKYKTASVLQER